MAPKFSYLISVTSLMVVIFSPAVFAEQPAYWHEVPEVLQTKAVDASRFYATQLDMVALELSHAF